MALRQLGRGPRLAAHPFGSFFRLLRDSYRAPLHRVASPGSPFSPALHALRRVHSALRSDPPDGGDHFLVAAYRLAGVLKLITRAGLVDEGDHPHPARSEDPRDAQPRSKKQSSSTRSSCTKRPRRKSKKRMPNSSGPHPIPPVRPALRLLPFFS